MFTFVSRVGCWVLIGDSGSDAELPEQRYHAERGIIAIIVRRSASHAVLDALKYAAQRTSMTQSV
ncbi:hypothetical protein, partial [Pseudomonas amygdali]|uniref:hypothetical protein n=1 Tax=Pseudomonas amygdali TaxID=47877 RepID=UPI0021800A67